MMFTFYDISSTGRLYITNKVNRFVIISLLLIPLVQLELFVIVIQMSLLGNLRNEIASYWLKSLLGNVIVIQLSLLGNLCNRITSY